MADEPPPACKMQGFSHLIWAEKYWLFSKEDDLLFLRSGRAQHLINGSFAIL